MESLKLKRSRVVGMNIMGIKVGVKPLKKALTKKIPTNLVEEIVKDVEEDLLSRDECYGNGPHLIWFVRCLFSLGKLYYHMCL